MSSGIWRVFCIYKVRYAQMFHVEKLITMNCVACYFWEIQEEVKHGAPDVMFSKLLKLAIRRRNDVKS